MIAVAARPTEGERRSAGPAPEPLLGPAFLDCLRRLDFGALEELLAPDVWLRALLVRVVHESSGAREAAEAFRDWSKADRAPRMIDSEHHVMAGREHVRYRWLLRPAWAPDAWHLVEQSGYLRVRDGRISRLDLACTGYHPADPAETGTG